MALVSNLYLFARINTLQVENKAKLVSCLESKDYIPHQVCEVIIRLATDDLMSSSDVVSIVCYTYVYLAFLLSYRR